MLYGQYDDTEIWKRHPACAQYSCSTMGIVRRDSGMTSDGRSWKGRILRPYKNNHGSWMATLHVGGERHVHSVGKLVLETFCGPCPAGEEACHGPVGRDCHQLSNLYWGTRQRNREDMVRDGTVARGNKIGISKLVEEQVRAIRADGRFQYIVASDYGITQGHVSAIKKGAVWSHVANEVA